MIGSVFRFQNGKVISFDLDGDQIPELTGKWEELRAHIQAARALTWSQAQADVTIHDPGEWFNSGPHAATETPYDEEAELDKVVAHLKAAGVEMTANQLKRLSNWRKRGE